MLKNKGIIIVPALLIAGLLTFIYAKDVPADFTKDTVSADALWNRLTKIEDYHQYAYWPDHIGLLPGRAPHGPFNKVFINSTIKSALPISNKIIPVGGIIVKEGYDIDKELVNINVMVKVKDYYPQENDWFWAQYTPDGKVVTSGKVSLCIGCHKAFKDNNCVVSHRLDK